MKVCSLRLPPQVLEELREVAEQTDRTVGQTMRRIIETFLADYKQSERIDTDGRRQRSVRLYPCAP